MSSYNSCVGELFKDEDRKHLREIVLKDFMCAIISGLHSNAEAYHAFIRGAVEAGFNGSSAEYIAHNSTLLLEAYFNQLNK